MISLVYTQGLRVQAPWPGRPGQRLGALAPHRRCRCVTSIVQAALAVEHALRSRELPVGWPAGIL